MDKRILQAIRDQILGVTTTPGDLNTSIYWQQIRDALLGVSPARTNGNLDERIYMQQVRNAIKGVPDGAFGSLRNTVYIQQIINALNNVADGSFGSLDEDTYLEKLNSSPLTYAQRVRALFGSSLIAYWPLDEMSGSVARDISGNGRNGAYTGVTLGGAGDIGASALFDGSTSYCDIYSPSFSAAFNGAEGTLSIFYHPASPGVWTDGTLRIIFSIVVDINNRIDLYRSSNNNQVGIRYRAGGIDKTITFAPAGFSPVGWCNAILTWSKSGDAAKLRHNGVQYGSTLTSLGTWAGAPVTAATLIGAASKTPTSVWSGNLCHVLFLNRAATDAESKTVVRLAGGKILSFIGDSITVETNSTYAPITSYQYLNGKAGHVNHGAASATIMPNSGNDMDGQVSAAATDDADLIVMALGTNDNNAGDMAALRAKVESSIVALRASNPRATIYYMNVLPKWTNNTGATPVDKGNIRTAIAAACTAQSITCWDTFSTPWITAAQTSDGTHPTAAGHAAIAAQVLARLP